jgi:hypothetical protein
MDITFFLLSTITGTLGLLFRRLIVHFLVTSAGSRLSTRGERPAIAMTSQESFGIGQLVVLQGLQARPRLNGRLCFVVREGPAAPNTAGFT